MPCFFSIIGQVTSVNSGTGGSRNAVILFREGPLGGNGEDHYFEVSFWLEGDTNLITNKCYLLQGTVVQAKILPDMKVPPKVIPLNLLLNLFYYLPNINL